MEEWGKYYGSQSVVTDPEKYISLYDTLPDDIPSLCKVIQGLLLHRWWTEQYGVNISEEQKEEIKIRKMTRQLKRIQELNDSHLIAARKPDSRLVGTCRDYASFLTSFLRHKGIPARMRVGFATYLMPSQYIDHYLCQYWNNNKSKWVMVDAQIDDLQRRAMNITFDTCDVPEDLFLPGGKAWQTWREGKVNPDLFGIFEVRGSWFIGCDMIFDAMSLNKIESHPFDVWPLMPRYQQKEYSKEYLDIIDKIADLTGRLNPDFFEVRSLYQTEKRLQPPADWIP